MKSLRIGEILYGYCGGSFGRDSYAEKRVEAIGADWVVCRSEGVPCFYSGNPNNLCDYRTPEESDR